ncbi:MAG TPA: nuclear transport factor 2 family protein [Solirubrobacterales bacterium]|nr:nuclear transport factor 2 family protein [Solirubrobacterales bacterium]
MSQENVEVIRSIYEGFNRSDWDAVFRDLPPDFELTTPTRGLDPGRFRGREEGQAYWEDFFAPYKAVTVEPGEIFESGDQVVVFVGARLRPKGSTAEMEVRIGHLWTFQDGTAVSLRLFPEHEKALEAAGLSE